MQTDSIQQSVSAGSYQLKLQPDQVAVSVVPIETVTKDSAGSFIRLIVSMRI